MLGFLLRLLDILSRNSAGYQMFLMAISAMIYSSLCIKCDKTRVPWITSMAVGRSILIDTIVDEPCGCNSNDTPVTAESALFLLTLPDSPTETEFIPSNKFVGISSWTLFSRSLEIDALSYSTEMVPWSGETLIPVMLTPDEATCIGKTICCPEGLRDLNLYIL